jgi:hypothetical protein
MKQVISHCTDEAQCVALVVLSLSPYRLRPVKIVSAYNLSLGWLSAEECDCIQKGRILDFREVSTDAVGKLIPVWFRLISRLKKAGPLQRILETREVGKEIKYSFPVHGESHHNHVGFNHLLPSYRHNGCYSAARPPPSRSLDVTPDIPPVAS